MALTKKKWTGFPWEQQRARIKESDRAYQAFMRFTRGETILTIAESMALQDSTVKKWSEIHQWRHRLESFAKFPDAPEHVSLQQAKRIQAKERAQGLATPEDIKEQRKEELSVVKEVTMLQQIADQGVLLLETYDRIAGVEKKYWAALEVAVDALLKDKERLKNLSVTEIKNLQAVALETAEQKNSLNREASGLEKLAGYVTKQLQSKQRRRKR